MVEIKDRIKEALAIRHMTASELANKSGINKGGISKYINGLIIPKQNAIASMARALGVSPAWLMGYDPVCSTNRPLDFIEFQAVFIFLWANFGQKKNPTAYAMG